ncbi:MAG: branched-chain amino acid ABC transporter substrate-binding protein [Chloroflexi bacterium]|nr:branched-chain amino acid ABC transporter substrate-binding protein [Chloroflexota bacterium]
MQKRTSLLALLLILALVLAACPAPAQPVAAPAEQPAAAATAAPAAEPTAAPAAEAMDMTGKVVIAPGQTIRIGGSFALTGPIPDPGKDIRQAAEIAVDDLNAMGGLEGFLFELVAEDGACSGDQGTVVGNKFAADPTIVAVSGGTCSGETFGLTPALQEARIPFVSPSATNPAVVSAECDVCNRTALSDALQGVVDADFVFSELGKTKIAVMHDNSDYGKGLAEIFQGHIVELGGEVTNFEGVQVGDTDFRAALAKIGANAPEFIFFGGYSTEAALIAQQMGETPGLDGALFMSDDGAYTKQYLDAAGDAAEGTYMSFVAGADAEAANAEFDAKYVDKFGVSPDDLGPFHGQSYDSVMVIAAAIKAVAVKDGDNLVIDREELLSAIRSVSGLDGLTGTLSCNEIGECGAGGVQIFTVTGGEFQQVAGFGME